MHAESPLSVDCCPLSRFSYKAKIHIFFQFPRRLTLFIYFLANESVDVKGVARKDVASKKYDFIGVFGG